MLKKQKNFALGVLTFLCGVFFLQLMGIVIKFIGSSYPSIQLSLYRNIFGLIPILLFFYFSKNTHKYDLIKRIPKLWVSILRGFFMAFAQFCFFTSLIFLKFATATSLTLLTPFIVAIFSIPILGTKIDFWKWIAIIIGFSGAIVIISPSNEIFITYALLPLGASFGYGMNLVLVRLFPKDIPTIIIQWHSQISSIFFSLLFLLLTFQYVEILNFQDLILVFSMGFLGGTGVYLMMASYRMTNHINLGPFHYFSIIFSFALGWLFFQEAPFDELLPGIFFIVFAGMIIYWRETISSNN